jgi:hypothetical protein
MVSQSGYYLSILTHCQLDLPQDPMSESLLITATAPSATSKVKLLELCNPTTVVEMKYAGTLSFRWAFKWEE